MAEPMHRHNGGPLSEEDARKLWCHVRALEVLDEQMNEIREDRKVRKELAKKDSFDPNIVEAIIKRRKIGHGETRTADTLIKLYEEAMEDEGVLPLEQTRISPAPRRDLEEISQDLHGTELGEAAPPGGEDDLERSMREFRERFPDVTISVGAPAAQPTPPSDAPADAPF